jgi:D-psicose/D-tagatose/L-ribulose 3-epimerase
MKIGISAFAWTADFRSSHLDLLPAIKEMGFGGVEVPMFDPKRLPANDIKRAFRENQLDCTVCAILPSGMNPISPDRQTRQTSIDHLKQCIDTAVAMDAKLLGGPLFAPIGYLPEHRPTKDEWTWAVEAFQSVGEMLDSTNLTVTLEPVNRSETFFVRTAETAAQLCDSIGNRNIGVTIDTFHANMEERSVPGAIRSLGPRLRHLHASENDRGVLGRGHMPWSDVVSALKEINYQGYVMIEGFGYSPDEKGSPGYLWADRDVPPERFAAESYHYLSSLL